MSDHNRKRAENVGLMALAYAGTVGTENESRATIAGDMICDLLHWVAAGETDPKLAEEKVMRVCATGLGGFFSESAAENGDDIGPTCDVALHALTPDFVRRFVSGNFMRLSR